MIDVHCHLTSPRFDRDREEVIRKASQRLEAAIMSVTHPEEAEDAFSLAEKSSFPLYITMGLHPKYAAQIQDKQLQDYLDLIRHNSSRVVGIGEIGLDYHWVRDETAICRMKEVFMTLLELAGEVRLPVVLHLRNALSEGLRMVTESGADRVMFHCFGGTEKQVGEIASEGYCISIATNILRDRGNALRKAPRDYVVTETDSPYLGPGRERNVPQNVSLVIDKLAALWDLSPREVDGITSRNARRFFGLPA